MTINTYRKKPVEVQAIQWTGHNETAIKEWAPGGDFTTRADANVDSEFGKSRFTARLWVDANEQWLGIETGEWIIRDSKGLYPCKPDIFASTYEPVEGCRHYIGVTSMGNMHMMVTGRIDADTWEPLNLNDRAPDTAPTWLYRVDEVTATEFVREDDE